MLGVSERTFRRYAARYEVGGREGLRAAAAQYALRSRTGWKTTDRGTKSRPDRRTAAARKRLELVGSAHQHTRIQA